MPAMSLKLAFAAALLALSSLASAQGPRVLLDTDRGPLLVELDDVRAPITSANFLRYVDDRAYDGTLLARVARNFVVQGGGFRDNGAAVVRRPAIASERTNGLRNTAGTLAMALSGNPPNTASATSDFFFNTGANTTLDGNFTVFGRLVFGTRTLANINDTPIIPGTEQPYRIPHLRRAVRVAAGEFPILPLHTGAWFDPNNSGKGFTVEISNTGGSETNPLVLIGWYDYVDGEQIWMTGTAPYVLGASSVEIPLIITRGGEFGAAFEPSQVTTDNEWGRITLRFTGCDAATFTYTSRFGNGTVNVRSLTLPTNESCIGN